MRARKKQAHGVDAEKGSAVKTHGSPRLATGSSALGRKFYGVGISACTWLEYALSVPLPSTAVTT
jgi:hypothetical protein